jgi:micrococcal nuclease
VRRLALALVVLALALAGPDPPAPSPAVGKVVAVHDGDTATVRTVFGDLHVRMLLIDAPELGQHPWGEAARWYATAALLGRDVRLEYDRTHPDPYGRTLAYIHYARDGKDVVYNTEVVRDGWAFYYDPGPELGRSTEVHAAEAEAKAKARGVWRASPCPLERPADWRRARRESAR